MPRSKTARSSPTSTALHSVPDLAPVASFDVASELGLILRDLSRHDGIETVLVVTALPGEPAMEVIASAGLADAPEAQAEVLPADFAARAVTDGRPAFEWFDAQRDHSLGSPASGLVLTHGASTPLHLGEGPPGALCVGLSGAPYEADSELLWIIDTYARLVSLSLRDGNLLQTLLVAARRDGLTGALNFATLNDELERELERCRRQALDLACAFIDLDGFKQINEVHGHLEGNRVLALVAAELRASLRRPDTLGRFGGDEFVALLPGSDEAAAAVLAARLRRQVATTTGIPGLDASVGVAQWQPGWSAEDVLAAANLALRAAKAAGGGAVHRASATDPAG